MRITISQIDMKPKRCIVHTTDGRKLGCYVEKLSKFNIEAGCTYDIETTDVQVNDMTLTNISSAKRVAAAAPTPQQQQAASQQQERFVSGAFRSASGPLASAGPAASRKDEQIFVQGILQALIRAGEVKNDKTSLWTTTQMLRGLWRHTFGFEVVNQHMEAAE